jgi:hypothetical protein
MSVGFKRRLKDWSRIPEPVPAASGKLVQPLGRRPHVSWIWVDPSIRVMQRAKPGSDRQGDDQCCHQVKP